MLSGFGAFPGVPRNATADVIAAIARGHGIELRARSFRSRDFRCGRGSIRLASGRSLHASLLILPVSWSAAGAIVIAEARATRASLVVMSGVAAPTQSIALERGASGARKAVVDAFGARPARPRSMCDVRAASIDVERARDAATRALDVELASSDTLARVALGVTCEAPRADNAYVCNATAHTVARARLRSARHGFVHWPRDIAEPDVPACARVLLAMADALTAKPSVEAE